MNARNVIEKRLSPGLLVAFLDDSGTPGNPIATLAEDIKFVCAVVMQSDDRGRAKHRSSRRDGQRIRRSSPHLASDYSRRTTATSTAAVRLSLRWFGVRKTLSPEQKAEAAEAFGAAGEFLSAGKKLLDTRHPAYSAVTSVRGRIPSVWKGLSLPYPEPGVPDRVTPAASGRRTRTLR